MPGCRHRAGRTCCWTSFEGLGLHCEARTQLVVLCEVCQRPSTKECWTCGMKICDFCTLKRHWKVGDPACGLVGINLTHRADAVAPRSFTWILSCLRPLFPCCYTVCYNLGQSNDTQPRSQGYKHSRKTFTHIFLQI